MLLINANQSFIQLFATCTELLIDHKFVLLLAIALLTFTKLTHGNIVPRCHDHVEVCIPPHNNEAATFSCCSRDPSECMWVREGNLSGNLGQETETGLKLTLQSLPGNYGQYNCLYRADERVVKQLLFIPRDMYQNCPSCMSVEVCTNNTEVILTLKTLFNTSLLHAHVCDTNATTSHIITLNTSVVLQNEGIGYSFDCLICQDGSRNIHYYIARSAFTNASSCVNYSTSSKSTISSMAISSSSSVNNIHSTSFTPIISSASTSPSIHVSSLPSAILSNEITMLSTVTVTPSLGPTLTPSSSGNSDGDSMTEVIIGVSVGLLITGAVLLIAIVCCLYKNTDIRRNKHNTVHNEVTEVNIRNNGSATNCSNCKPERLMGIIYKLQPEIEQCLDVDELMAYLNKYSILTDNERDELGSQHSKTRIAKARYLLAALSTKGPQAQKNFMLALNESSHAGHKHLFELLQANGANIHCETQV